MRYIITEFDIFNAITCVGQENKFLWDSANSGDLEVETRMESHRIPENVERKRMIDNC